MASLVDSGVLCLTECSGDECYDIALPQGTSLLSRGDYQGHGVYGWEELRLGSDPLFHEKVEE